MSRKSKKMSRSYTYNLYFTIHSEKNLFETSEPKMCIKLNSLYVGFRTVYSRINEQTNWQSDCDLYLTWNIWPYYTNYCTREYKHENERGVFLYASNLEIIDWRKLYKREKVLLERHFLISKAGQQKRWSDKGMKQCDESLNASSLQFISQR